MADGQSTVTGGSYFDQINASLNQYREKKQRGLAPPPQPKTPKPAAQGLAPTPVQPKPQSFSFDNLTQDLAQRRQQRGDNTPVLAAQPQQPAGQEVLKTAEKVNDWTSKQGDRLGTWAASKLTLSPDQVKKQLDKVPSSVMKLMHYGWGAEQGFVTPYSEQETRQTAQKVGEASQKVETFAIKQAADFITSPMNIAFMLASGGSANVVKTAIDYGFSSMMAIGAFEGVDRAFKAGEAANWDVFSSTSKDGKDFQYKPEAAAFWQAVGDSAVSTFFARMGIKGMAEQADYLHTYGQFDKAAKQQFGKPWAALSEDQKATTTAVVQANHAKGIDGIRQYAEQAQKFGLQDPMARLNTKDLLPELNAQLTKHRRALQEADLLIDNAPEKKVSPYDLEPVPVLGEVKTEKQSKIWTPEGEKEVTISEPAAAQPGNHDLAVLNPQDREFARQKQREDYAHSVIEQERQRREQEYARKAQQTKDQIKREAERRQKAEEAGLKVEERRPVRYMTDAEVTRLGLSDAEQAMTSQMEAIAERNMYANPDQMLKYLRRTQRDVDHTPEEKDFLRMAHEREMLRHYQDPQNLAPVTREGGALGVKPSLDMMRERLADVTSPEQARDVLTPASDEELSKLMIPLNQAFAETGSVYGNAGERPLFSDGRGELREGSSWQRHEGVDVQATVPVNTADVPKWAIPGDDGRFILQVTKEGDGVFGEDDYTEPAVILGKVDPAAERRNWNWTDWAAHEKNRRDNALFEDLAAVDRQNDLENAAVVLGEQATHATTPEEADELAKKSQEAEQQAKAIEQERLQEENKEQAKDIPVADFPEKAPVKEIARGRSTEVSLPSGRKLKAHYALVSLDDLIVSHLPMENFQANDDYTAKPLQPNDYASNEHRQDEVKYRASNPDFGQIFNTSSTGDQGPPTVRRDGIVAGGNGRLMSLEMLYASGRGNEVVNAIEQTKDQFGIDVPTPNFEDSPTIVRVLDEPLERKEEVIDVGQQMNVSTMTKRNAAEDAAATALRFTPDMMNWIVNAFDAMDDDASLRDFMRKYAVELADRYEKLGIIAHNERGAFINDKGEINADAKLKFERAVRGAVIKDPVALAILEQPGMAAQSAALDRALPGLLRMVAKGGIWDVSDYLAPAIKRWESINDLRGKLQDEVKLAADHGQKGVTLVDAYLYPEQVKGTTRTLGDFTERPRVDKITESIMRLMEKKSKDIKEAFNGYSLDAEGLQASLVAPPEPWESFETHIGSKVGVQVDQSDWGRTEAKPEPSGVSQAAVPPVAPAVPADLPEKKFKFGSTQTDIPDDSEAAKALTAARERVADADTMEKGKDVGGNHVTVRYGIDSEDTAGIKAFLSKQSPFEATLGKTDKFPPSKSSEGAAVIVAPIEAPELHRLNDELEKHGKFIEPTFKEYKPHATVAYVKPEAAERYVGMDVTEGKKFRIDSIAITNRDGNQEVVKLQGLEAPPLPPVAVTPETGGTTPVPPDLAVPFGEEALRAELAKHSGISPSQREGMIQVWKAFAEKYQGVPFDEWVREKWTGVETGGEYKGEGASPQAEGKVVRGETLWKDGSAIMRLFEKANFSTFAHESFHIMRRYLKPEDTAVLEKAFKVKEHAWGVTHEEKAARSWEKYLRDGEAPNAELKTLFAKIKNWMTAIYAKIKGGPLEGIKVSDEVKAVFDRMLTGERGPEPPVQDLDKPPLSPSDKTAETLLQLLQEDTATDRDKKIGIIQQRLKGAMHPDVRKKFEGLLAQLQGDAKFPEKLTSPPEAPKTAPKPAAEPLTPAPKKTIKIWTPSGEIEVEREERPSAKTEPEADRGRRTVNGVDRDKGTRPPEPLPEQPRSAARSDEKPAAVRPVSAGKRAGGKGSEPGVDRKTLPDVQPTRIDAPKRERGEPLYSSEEWEKKRATYGLPQGMPAPDVKLDSDLARLLIFPGQRELAESALSGLKQYDSYILASTTGTGKTRIASAVLSQIMRRDKPQNVLILTKSQNLVREFRDVALDYDVEVKRLPDDSDIPSEPGVYSTTYATARMRDGLQKHPWDFVIMDEIAEARRWYDSKQGAAAKDLAEHSGKVLYMSATPFHTALEAGHMTKLGLWNSEGFDTWGKQFGIYRDKEGNYGGGNAPKKLVKLRQQLIERGQYANIDRNMDGYNPHFLLAPLSEESKLGLRNIVEAFDLAKDYYARKGQQGKMRALQGNMVVYMKSYLERQRLPEAIELAKRAEKEGYKAIIFSEHKAGREDLFKLLEEPDQYWGGKISAIFPRLPDVVDELQKAFPNDLANFSGKESVMRSEEKDAFLANEKKHIFATYGAGGVGVSLHDTNGKYPRVAIYLGPPYSGVMLDQAIGRPWRYGTKSNVQAYFMLSNARDEVDLVIKKVGPRLESLRALVSGIDMTDPMTMAMRKLESSESGALAYDLGQEHTTDKDGLTTTYDKVPIMNWREAPMPSASEAMNKGMRFPGEGPTPHPGIERMMQADEYEPPKDLVLPDSVEARLTNEQTAEDFANGDGAHGMTAGELQAIPKPERVEIAEGEKLLAEAAAKENPEAPQANVRRTWENAAKIIDAAKDLPPSKAGRSINWIWFTNGHEVIRRAAARSGKAELGSELARDIAKYHQETGNVAGPFQLRYYEISKRLTPEEHDNAWLVKEGATRKDASGKKVPVEPMNEKVVQAVKDMTKLLQDVKDVLAKENVYTEFYDETSGRRMQIPFSEQLDDPHYMPHRYDYDKKIVIEDPQTGAKETVTLRDILKGKDLGQARYERIVHSLAAEHGVSEAEVQDWLARKRRDVPLVGNIERSREAELPFYRTDPEAMIGYLEGVGETVARTRVFGQDRNKLEFKLRGIPEQRDRALIRDIFDSLLSRKQWDEDTRAFVHVAADWAVLSKMAFSAVKIPFHMLHASLYTNGRTMLKTMFEGATNYREMRDRAIYSGAVLEQMRANLASELGMDQRFASKMLKFNQFHNAYTMDRALTNASARIWMDDSALPKLIKNPRNDRMRRELKEVYLMDDNTIDQAIAAKRWTQEDYARGGKALSDRVMFTFDPTELPPGWRARSNDPIADSALAGARVALLLKSFMFKTGVILKDRLWSEAKKGNFRPWIPFLAFYPVAGEAMRQLTGALTFNPAQIQWWQNPANQEPAKILERAAEDIGYTTALTNLFWLVKAPLGQKGWAALEEVLGPVYSDIVRTIYKFPSELHNAKSDYSIHNAMTRYLEETAPLARPLVRAEESATGWDAAAEKKKADKERGQRSAQTRHERKYGNAKPL